MCKNVGHCKCRLLLLLMMIFVLSGCWVALHDLCSRLIHALSHCNIKQKNLVLTCSRAAHIAMAAHAHIHTHTRVVDIGTRLPYLSLHTMSRRVVLQRIPVERCCFCVGLLHTRATCKMGRRLTRRHSLKFNELDFRVRKHSSPLSPQRVHTSSCVRVEARTSSSRILGS